MEMLSVVPLDSLDFLLDCPLDDKLTELHRFRAIGLVLLLQLVRGSAAGLAGGEVGSARNVLAELSLQDYYLLYSLPPQLHLSLVASRELELLLRRHQDDLLAIKILVLIGDLSKLYDLLAWALLAFVHGYLEDWEVNLDVDVSALGAFVEKEDAFGCEAGVLQGLGTVDVEAVLFVLCELILSRLLLSWIPMLLGVLIRHRAHDD